jgi:hypothetical protein
VTGRHLSDRKQALYEQIAVHSEAEELRINRVRGPLMDSSPSSELEGREGLGRVERAQRILRALGSLARLSADLLGQTNLPLVDEMASLPLSLLHCNKKCKQSAPASLYKSKI